MFSGQVSVTSPGQDTNPSQASSQQKLVLFYTAESTGTSRVKCPTEGHDTIVRPRFEPTTFSFRVKCLSQGHNTVVWPGLVNPGPLACE